MARLLSSAQARAGERLPWWQAIAYWDFDRQVAVAFPLGLHFIVRCCRTFWFWMHACTWPESKWDAGWFKAKELGRKQGFDEGFEEGYRAAFKDIRAYDLQEKTNP
jgi:hypothetical protein